MPSDAGQLVVLHVVGEGHGPLPQVAHDRLRAQRVVEHPRVRLRVDVVGGVQELARAGCGWVTSASRSIRSSYSTPAAFSSATSSPFALLTWAARTGPGFVEDRLDHRHDVERVGRVGLAVEQVEGGEGERGQRLVEGEVGLQVDGDPHEAAPVVGLVEPLDDPGREQRPVDGDGPADVAALRGPRLVVVGEQPLHGAAPVAGRGRAR